MAEAIAAFTRNAKRKRVRDVGSNQRLGRNSSPTPGHRGATSSWTAALKLISRDFRPNGKESFG